MKLARVAVMCATGGLLLACAGALPGTIGAALGKRTDGRLFVRSVPEGQGAAKAGLAVGDEILAIDGKDVKPMTEDEIRRAVRGEAGSKMILRVERGGAVRDVEVVRSPLLAEGKDR